MDATIDAPTSVSAAAICCLLDTFHHMVATIDSTTYLLVVASTDLSMAAAKTCRHLFEAAANMCMTAVHTIFHTDVAAASPTLHHPVPMGLCPFHQAAACLVPWLGSGGFV